MSESRSQGLTNLAESFALFSKHFSSFVLQFSRSRGEAGKHSCFGRKIGLKSKSLNISNLKIANVGSVFSVVKSNKPGVSSLNTF